MNEHPEAEPRPAHGVSSPRESTVAIVITATEHAEMETARWEQEIRGYRPIDFNLHVYICSSFKAWLARALVVTAHMTNYMYTSSGSPPNVFFSAVVCVFPYISIVKVVKVRASDERVATPVTSTDIGIVR